jgi:hypothetical protein
VALQSRNALRKEPGGTTRRPVRSRANAGQPPSGHSLSGWRELLVP